MPKNATELKRDTERVEWRPRLPFPLSASRLPTLCRLLSHHCSYFPFLQFALRLRPVLSPRQPRRTPASTRAAFPCLHTTLAASSPAERNLIQYAKRSCRSRNESYTFTTSVQRFHVEDVNALHFAEDFEALEAGGLVEVGGDGARFGAGG